MPRKLAIKRLTASDLTLFRWHFENRPAGNQKALNLNADVFIRELYPSLPETGRTRIPLDLFLYGPGLHGEYNLQRKIIRRGSYKNWRLDGEFIPNPEEAQNRFNVLRPDDYVILEFTGSILMPRTARAVFVATDEPEDAGLVKGCSAVVGQASMVAMTPSSLHRLVEEHDIGASHPVNQLLLEDALEDAALGGYEGQHLLRQRGSRRTQSPEALRDAKLNAELVGRQGEEQVDAYLAAARHDGCILDYAWVSEEDATSPFDFRIETAGGDRLVDVKSTAYEFDRPVHVSLAELRTMSTAEEDYDLYRVFELTEVGCKLRVAPDTRAFARSVLTAFQDLPQGVTVDSVSVAPSRLTWESEIRLAARAD